MKVKNLVFVWLFFSLSATGIAQDTVGVKSSLIVIAGEKLAKEDGDALLDQLFSLAGSKAKPLGAIFSLNAINPSYVIDLRILFNTDSRIAVAEIFRPTDDTALAKRILILSGEDEILTRVPGALVALWAQASGKNHLGKPPIAVASMDFGLFNEYWGLHSLSVPLDIAFGGRGLVYLPVQDRCIALDGDFRLSSVIQPEKVPTGSYYYRAAVNSSGTLFLSSSLNGDIFRIAPGQNAAERIPAGSQVHMRIAALPDGSLLTDDISTQSFALYRGRKKVAFQNNAIPSFSYAYMVDTEGFLRTVDTVSSLVRVFTNDEKAPFEVPYILPAAESFYPQQIQALGGGDFILADQRGLACFNRDGLLRWRLGSVEDPFAEGEALTIGAMAVDPGSGSIYIIDYSRRKVLKLIDGDYARARGNLRPLDEKAMLLSRRISDDSVSSESYLALAKLYSEAGAHEAAYTLYQRAADIFPDLVSAQDAAEGYRMDLHKTRTLRLVAECLEILGRLGPESSRQKYSEAIASFEVYLSLRPQDAQMRKGKADFEQEFSLQADPAKRQSPRLEFMNARMENLIPAYSQLYARQHPLSLGLKNSSKDKMEKLRAQVFIKDFMAFPEEKSVADILLPGQSMDLSLGLRLDRSALALEEDLPTVALLSLNYEVQGRSYSQSKTLPLTIYRKSSISWKDSKSLSAFITPNDSILGGFSAAALSADGLPSLYPRAFSKAMGILSALGAHGIAYVEDPESGVSKALGKAEILDTVRLPRVTLLNKVGDCDDISALSASLLEGVGLQTAILTSPGHVYLAFCTGEAPSMAWMYSTADTFAISMEGKLWIPFESTLLSTGFSEAWKKGCAL